MQLAHISHLRQGLSQGDLLIDVREPYEFDSGHVRGAINIPLSQLANKLPTIPLSKRIFVICASGSRSMEAAKFLSLRGYEALSVANGTSGWAAAGMPLTA
ncbi:MULTISPECIES: rhodanese-like domain-containing protein [Acidithrix]|uniref:Thiosulfate sulfurtransferase PspE n=1 Tax=Acidithrix ferrooxidans TaxID=1280514 RepID=A0A0D8HG47_9ACTN|nr:MULTISPECIES: rhodanese-like domain-containing protein [Acidithrix]KJF16888.1 thiosulfate sulfurtransferase PspE precursor [Acidithrix ferrooxidans]